MSGLSVGKINNVTIGLDQSAAADFTDLSAEGLSVYDQIKFFNGDGLTLNDSSNTNLLVTTYDTIDDTDIDVSSGAFWQQIGWNDQSYSKDNLNDASKVSVSTGGIGTTVYTFHDVVNILKKLGILQK